MDLKRDCKRLSRTLTILSLKKQGLEPEKNRGNSAESKMLIFITVETDARCRDLTEIYQKASSHPVSCIAPHAGSVALLLLSPTSSLKSIKYTAKCISLECSQILGSEILK